MTALLALILERLLGYPEALVARIGHPVIWMGRLIGWLDTRLNDRTRRRGVLALVLLLAATATVTVPLAWLLRSIPFGWGLEALLAASLLAQKSLRDAVRAVAVALARSLPEGRAAVSHIVGRDPQALDEPGVARAAIESLAESTLDAVVAPLFWLLLLGLPGIVLYKAVNTADSMIGHKTERHVEFGWASARFDDLLNLVPARLAALLVFLVTGRREALTVWRRDARLHPSPNAGPVEAATAGALGVRLGGTNTYDGEAEARGVLGDGRAVEVRDVARANRLSRQVSAAAVLVAAGTALALGRPARPPAGGPASFTARTSRLAGRSPGRHGRE
jgi:adenosylcobinamide-phosphate synthase